MKRSFPVLFIRASLFNLAFILWHVIACLFFMPTLILPKRRIFFVVRAYLFVLHICQKYILGLDWKVEGLENLPQDGAYIVAAKHQSTCETLMLHPIFGKPAIVLKQELIRIPLWGRFLASVDPIAIDRSQRKAAMQQIIDAARVIAAQNRAIIIFVQGTRVYTHETPAQKPYKGGAARIQMETGLPIVPMALNTGLFWPRKGWMKYPGQVTFSLLPPVPYDPARTLDDIMAGLEETIEGKTHALEAAARAAYPYLPGKPAQNMAKAGFGPADKTHS